MDAAPDLAALSPGNAWRAGFAPPAVEAAPLTGRELDAWFRGGEPEADTCEALLTWAARARGALDVAIAEGLDALRRGDRLAELACHLYDYAREVLDLGKRAAEGLALLGRELRTRPLLREALTAGRVKLRAAQTVLKVAVGEDEAVWVERAARMTVRALEAEVRRARTAPGDEEEPWLRLGVRLEPAEREVLDEALALAGELMPGATRAERLEAIAQEFAGEYAGEGDPDAARVLGAAVRPSGARTGDTRAAALEEETERWAALRALPDIAAPDVRFYETATAHDVDGRLRELAALRAEWEDLVGYCALAVRKSQLYRLLGFASFRQYCEERLGLAARSIEERAKVEERRWASPALQEAKREGLPFEKLRLLSKLPEPEIARWAARAKGLTCVALRRELEGEAERRMRAQGRLAVPLALRMAAVLAAAVQAVRDRTGRPLPLGTCLAVLAQHFLDTWKGGKRARTRSRKVRERDEGHCQVPGCSRRATHAHHVLFRSQ
ncbi:HNH endonuclease, partial [Anaeromyxobacter diazotrophicus]|uniref:HNH endonuclease n=1 Tax=Anaeromyxobacter diazotrophicus TaxID=2590199 RepID=UPI00158FB1DB